MISKDFGGVWIFAFMVRLNTCSHIFLMLVLQLFSLCYKYSTCTYDPNFVNVLTRFRNTCPEDRPKIILQTMSRGGDSVKQNDKNTEEYTFSAALQKTPFWNSVGFLDIISRDLIRTFCSNYFSSDNNCIQQQNRILMILE